MSIEHAISRDKNRVAESGRKRSARAQSRSSWSRSLLILMRGWLYPLIPIAVYAAGIACLTATLHVGCQFQVVQDFYNTYVLWVVTAFHEYEHLAVWGTSATLLLSAGAMRHRLTKYGFDRARWTAGLYALLLLSAGGYMLSPWGLASLSWWWSIPTVTVLVWLWVRASWAYFGFLYPFVRRTIHAYWRATLDGRGYLDLLGRLRARQMRRVWSRRERPDLDSGFRSEADRLRCRRIELWFERCGQLLGATRSIPGIGWMVAQAVARLTPRVAESLAAEDLILVKELEYLADDAWAEAEAALYEVQDDAEPDFVMATRLQRFFQQWHLLADALLDCYLFEFFSGPRNGPLVDPAERRRSVETDRTWHSVCAGTSRLARYSRRLFLPTLSGRAPVSDDNPQGMFWWHGASLQGSFQLAAEFAELEIEAVNWLGWKTVFQGRRIDDRTTEDVELLALCQHDGARTDWENVLMVRLAIAIIVRRGLRQLDSNAISDALWLQVPEAVWEPLSESIAEVIRPLVLDPNTETGLREFAAETRDRFFDACLLSLRAQPALLRNEVDECELRWDADVARRQADQWFRGYACLHEAWVTRDNPDVRRSAYLSAVSAFRNSHHCSIATLPQVVEADLRRSIEFEGTAPVQRPDEPRYTRPQVHGSWERWSGRGRQPGLFFRLHLVSLWLVGCVGGSVLLHQGAAADLLPVPDLRLGGAHLHEPVNFVTAGIEGPEPSLWVATEGDGVHVKGGGKNHHWNQLTAESTRDDERPGLLADNVLCVQTDQPHRLVSYLSRRNGRPVVSVSDYPSLAPGTLPVTVPNAWSIFLGDSSFPEVDDQDMTVIRQADRCPLMLFGTGEKGLGRYHVADRRWLQIVGRNELTRDVTVNAANGFLRPSQNNIRDVATDRADDAWVAWVATPDGIAGGPIWPAGDDGLVWQPEKLFGPDDWDRVPVSQLIDPDVEQVRLWITPQGGAIDQHDSAGTLSGKTVRVDYRTAGGGLGTWTPERDGESSEHRVRVGQRSVPWLQADTLRRAVYSPADRQLWWTDRPGHDVGGDRILAYRETTHEWVFETASDIRDGRLVLDISRDAVRKGTLLAGTDEGVESLADSGGEWFDRSSHGPRQSQVLQVASLPDSVMARAVLRDEPSQTQRPGLYELARGIGGTLPSEQDADWQTVIGTRRFPKADLSLDDLTIVESATGESDQTGRPNLYFGTSSSGIGFIDRSTHEVFQPPETSRLDPNVLDLCAIPDDQNERDRWLLQVTSDHQVNGIPLGARVGDPNAKPVLPVALFNNTSAVGGGTILPDQLGAVRAWSPLPDDESRTQYLFVGGRGGGGAPAAVARYDIRLHEWAQVGSLQGTLTGFHTAADRFWAHTYSPIRQGALYLLGKDRRSWDPVRLTDIKPYAFDPAPNRMLAVTGGNGIVDVKTDGSNVALIEPKPATSGHAPLLAAVIEGGEPKNLYVGFEKHVARFDLDTWRWSDSLTTRNARPLQELQANASGAWLLDTAPSPADSLPSGNLYRRDAAGTESALPIGVDVLRDRLAVNEKDVAFINSKGAVYRWRPNGQPDGHVTTLVGDSLDVDLHRQARAVVRFPENDLCVAVGTRLGRYRVGTHDWQDVTPTVNDADGDAPGEVIEQLVATSGYLYMRDAAGRLFRSANPGSPRSWQQMNDLLAKMRPGGGITFGASSGSAAISWIGRVGSDLAIVVDSIGSFRLGDRALRPEWLMARSLGPDSDAIITCAAEIGDELYLGTSAGDLWAYVPVSGPLTPLAWQRLELQKAPRPAAPLRDIVPIPGDARHLAVLTSANVWLLNRDQAGVWDNAPQALKVTSGRPVAITAGTNGLFWTETSAAAGDATPTVLYRLNAPLTADSKPDRIVGPGMAAGSPTASVAVDTTTSLVLRADHKGNVSSYDWSTHTWHAESIGEGVEEPLRLFFAVGAHWALAAQKGALYRRAVDGDSGRATWSRYDVSGGAVANISHRLDGLLILTRNGRLLHVSQTNGQEHAAQILPEQRADAAVDWKQGVLAESGSWLLASDDEHLRAYHRDRHTWSPLLDTGIDRFFPATSNARPTAYYARNPEQQQLWFVSPASITDGTVNEQQVDLPRPADKAVNTRFPLPVVATLSDAQGQYRPVALAVDRSLHALTENTSNQVLVTPEPLRLPINQPPTVTATTEYGGQLVLALKTEETHSIAFYDPRSLHWQRVTGNVSGRIERFWPLRKALLVQMKGGAGGAFNLMVLDQSDDADRQWHVGAGLEVLDVSYDESQRQLWVIDQQQRIRRLELAKGDDDRLALKLDDVPELGIDQLPDQIRVALNVENEIIVLLRNGSVWQYSLQNLSWQARLAGTAFVDLLNSNGNIVAVEVGESGRELKYHRYQKAGGKWFWQSVTAEKTGELRLPAVERDRSADTWRVSAEESEKEFRFEWTDRPAEPKSRVHVGVSSVAEPGRFYFNRYRRLQWQNGDLWCETSARTRSGQFVMRQFHRNAGQAVLSEVQPGLPRFGRDFAKLKSQLDPPSAVAMSGVRFRVARADDGAWQTDHPDGQHSVSLRELGREIPVELRSYDPGRWELDIDRWNAIVADGEWLHVSTQGGIVSLRESDLRGAGVLRRGFQPSDQPLLVRHGSDAAKTTLYAQEKSGRILQLSLVENSPTWTVQTDAKGTVSRAFAHDQSVHRSNVHLTNWLVAEDGKLLMRSTSKDSDWSQVTLSPAGFEFDRVVSLELEARQVALYGADGRVRYNRATLQTPPVSLENEWSTRAVIPQPGDVLHIRRDKDNLSLLTGRSDVWRHVAPEWQKLKPPEAESVQKWLGQTLLDGHANDGWTWDSDETVVLPADARVGRDRDFAAWFDQQTGQFAFDTCFDLTLHDRKLLAATRAGVATWNDSKLATLDPATAASREAPATAGFLRAAHPSPVLELRTGAGNAQASHIFQLGDRWAELPEQPSAAARTWHRTHLAAGARWQVRRDRQTGLDAGDSDAAGLRVGDAEFHWMPRVGVTFQRWLEASKTWRLEDVHQICLLGSRTVLATERGLLDPTARVLGDVGPVRRVVSEAGLDKTPRLHAQVLEQGSPVDRWFEPDLTSPSPDEGIPFVELDRTLLATVDGLHWNWKRDNDGRIEIRIGPSAGRSLRPTEFAAGRFDFDRVGDLLFGDGQVLLATAAGFVHRPLTSPSDGSFRFAGAPLPDASDVSRGNLFTLGRRDGRPRMIDLGPHVFQSTDGRTWTRLTEDKGRLAVKEGQSQLAQNRHWQVKRRGSGLSDELGSIEFDLYFDTEKPQPVEFSQSDGTFTFCVVNGLKQANDRKSVTVGTLGGLAHFDWSDDASQLEFQSLISQFPDSPPVAGRRKSIQILRLWRIDDGRLIALVRDAGQTGFRQFNAAEKSWDTITIDAASSLIQELDWVNRAVSDATHRHGGWSVRRVDEREFVSALPAPPSREELTAGLAASLMADVAHQDMELHFAGEPVQLVRHKGHTTFDHDVAVSLDWSGHSLFVASLAGVVRMQLDVQSGQLEADLSRPHLWTRGFQKPQRVIPFLIRDRDGDGTVVCRTKPDNTQLSNSPETVLVLETERNGWTPLEGRSDDSVLLPMDSLWQWSLHESGRGSRKLHIAPARTPAGLSRIRLPDADRFGVYRWFHDGRLAFWSLPELPLESPLDSSPPRDRLSVAGDVFVATDGGILQLAGTGKRRVTAIVHAVDEAGHPLSNVTDLSHDPVSGVLTALSRTSDGDISYEYKPDPGNPRKGDWQRSPHPYVGRSRPVKSGWLTIDHQPASPAVARFTAGISDLSPLPEDSSLFRDGRFAFDVVRDFVRRSFPLDDDGAETQGTPRRNDYWLLTPIGVARMDAGSGHVTKLYAASFGQSPPNGSLHLTLEPDRPMHIVASNQEVWLESTPGEWSYLLSSETANRLRTTVDNPLLRCVELDRSGKGNDRRYEIQIPGVDHSFGNTNNDTALLQAGILVFDAVRDMRHVDERLLIAARTGLWEYDLSDVSQLVARGADTRATVMESGGAVSDSVASARVPCRVTFNAAQSLKRLEPVRFIPTPDRPLLLELHHDELVSQTADGTWLPHAKGRPEPHRAVFSSTDSEWTLDVDANKLIVTAGSRDERSSFARTLSLGDGVEAGIHRALMTPDAIWIPHSAGLAWFRKPNHQRHE